MSLDVTIPTDEQLMTSLMAIIRETREECNTIATAVAALGYGTAFTLVTSASYSVLETDNCIVCDATANPIAVTLPNAADVIEGFEVKVKKSDATANIVTVWRQGTDTLDNGTNETLTLEGESATFKGNGVDKWYRFN